MKTKKKCDGCVDEVYTRQRIGKKNLCRQCVSLWMERAELRAMAEAPCEYVVLLSNEAWERMGFSPRRYGRGDTK